METLAEIIFSPKALKVLSIILSVFLFRLFINSLSVKVISAASDEEPRGKRLRTLTHIFNTFFSVFALMVGLFMVLKEIGFDITPLLASAGIVGLAIGFGAQTLVKDMLSGFFLILEGQFDEGDEVEINGKKGIVEKITLRTIWLRDQKKATHIIPNGSIILVTNYSKK